MEKPTTDWTIRQGSGDAKSYSTYATGSLAKAGGTITFPLKGRYELTLTLTGATGRTFTKSRSFTVSPIPTKSIGFPPMIYSGAPMAVTASGTEFDGASINWLIAVDSGEAKPHTQYATEKKGKRPSRQGRGLTV